MEELRRHTADDLPAVRALWQARFHDSDAFLDWLFSERYLPSYSVCLTVDGALASSALGYPMLLRVRGKRVPGLMISGVSTAEGFEHRGYMRRVMTAMMELCRADGLLLAFHKPVNLAVYTSLGHLPCADARRAVLRGPLSPAFPAACSDAPDIRLMTDCYAASTARYSGCVLRSADDMALKWRDYASDGARCLPLAVNGAYAGYAVLQPGEDGWDCPELLARSPADYAALLSLLPGGTFVKLPPDASELGETFAESVMGAADIRALLALLCDREDAVFAVSDPIVAENNGVFDGTGKPTDRKAAYTLSAGALMQHLSGYLPLEGLLEKETCYCVDEY